MNWKKYVVISVLVVIIVGIGVYVSANNQKIPNMRVEFLKQSNVNVESTTKDVAENKKVVVNNQEKNLEYKHTKNNIDIYVDDNKDEYIYNDEKLVGFLKESDYKENISKKIDMEVAKEIAKKFGRDNIEEFDKYELLYSNYIESYKEYSIKYVRKLNGFNTQDVVKVNVNELGEVVSFIANHQGEFDQYNDIQVEKEEINSLCVKAAEEKYGEKVKKTQIREQYFSILDGKLVLQTDLQIVLNENKSDELMDNYVLESLIYEVN